MPDLPRKCAKFMFSGSIKVATVICSCYMDMQDASLLPAEHHCVAQSVVYYMLDSKLDKLHLLKYSSLFCSGNCKEAAS